MLEPRGHDGNFLSEQFLRLGQIYHLSLLSQTIFNEIDLPRSWYGLVMAIKPITRQRDSVSIEIQPLPDTGASRIDLKLADVLQFEEAGLLIVEEIDSQMSLAQFNQTLNHKLIITSEHLDLIASNPDLFSDWKLHCLYKSFGKRHEATRAWLLKQDSWFDQTDDLDWILLAQGLTNEANKPNAFSND